MIHAPAVVARSIRNVMVRMSKFGVRIVVFLIFSIFVGNAMAETHLSFVETSVNPGDTVSIPVVLSSTETICGFQFNTPRLAEPFELIQIQFNEQTSSVDSWTVTSNQLYNGLHKIIGFDDELLGISGTDQEIARLVIHISKDADPGIYPLIPEHQILCDRDGNVISSYTNTEYLTITGSDVVFDMLDDTIGYYDRSKQMTILMSTLTSIAGFQFDIVDSADIFAGILCNNPFGEDWDVHCAELDNGVLRLLVSATTGELLPDSTDYTLIITVQTNSAVQAGSYPVLLENLIVSDENAESLVGSGLGAIIKVDSTLLSSFDLLLPVSGSIIDASVSNIEFAWNRSTFPTDPVINYKVYIGVKNYGELTESFVSEGNGTDTTLFLNSSDLRQAIESQGIPVQNPQEIYWWVVAADDRGNRQSESIFDLIVQRLTGIDQKPDGVPLAYKLFRNYPNPFNSQTTIQFEIPESAQIRLSIYNVLGQEVVTLVNRDFLAGRYRFHWNGLNQNGEPVKSGLYFLSFQARNYHSTQKIVFLK